jgi:hypothetical protein
MLFDVIPSRPELAGFADEAAGRRTPLTALLMMRCSGVLCA